MLFDELYLSRKKISGTFGEIYTQYFSTLSEDILTEALGQVLTDYNAPPPTRRRSTELPGSRRGSSSDASRRGSQSTGGSRRSSSRKSSSECSSDMEEYIQHLAARNTHKPSVIEEEEPVPTTMPVAELADDLMTSVLSDDGATVAVTIGASAAAEATDDTLLTFSSECWLQEAIRPTAIHSDRFCSMIDGVAENVVQGAMTSALEQLASSYQELCRHREVERYVESLLEDTWHDVLQGINEGRVRVVQVDEDSDTEDIDIDLFLFADSFVHGVLDSALLAYADEVRAERQQLEAMWRRACDKMELEAKYFNAEFVRGESTNAKEAVSRRKGSLNFVKGALAREMMRRRSLDETGWGNSRRRSSGFKDETLSSFENELIASNPNIPSLEVCSVRRRSSEPMPHGYDSIDTDFLSVTSEQTRASSLASTGSSRELLLEWLNQSQATSSSGSRKRTSSSHLDWYAHDLVLDAFNAAFVDMFASNYSKSDAAATASEEAIAMVMTSAPGRNTPPLSDDEPSIIKTPRESPFPIVTGNWGCGAYRGDPQLKCLIQWMAASHVHAPLIIYNTFGEPSLANAERLCHLVRTKCSTVGQLMAHILHYCDNRLHYKTHSLFDILTQMLEINTRPIC